MKKLTLFLAIFFIALAGSINAQKTPATLPYSCDFSNATERGNWYLQNTTDNMCASWTMMYDESNEENWYLGCGVDEYMDYGEDPVTVHAIRRFECGNADSIQISFRFGVRGEGTHENLKAWDYLAAFCYATDEYGGVSVGQTFQQAWLGKSDEYLIDGILYKDNKVDLLSCKLFNSIDSSIWVDNFTTKIKNPNPGGTADLQFVWTNDDDYSSGYACWVDNVSITPIVNYGITVAGVKVTAANCNNITGAKISGSVSYNDESKTLTLDNATIEGAIYFVANVKDITITLVGENAMTDYLGSVRGTKTINGTGSLKTRYIGCDYEKNTIIEDCTIDINNTSGNGALFSGNGDGSKLTIKNANISAEAGLCAMGDFKDIELIGCEIVEPANAQIIDNEVEVGGNKFAGKYICDGDGNVAKKVVIKPISYGIKVADVKVTSANCNNITGAKISGSVSYNHESKILTLDNATIDGDIGFGANVKDITITLVGENSIEGVIESVSGTKTINGTGSLKANFISCAYEQNTIIEDCTIDLYGNGNWVLCSYNARSKLTIKNANVSVESNMVAIGDFADIELVGCEIVEPVNAQIIDNEVEEEGFTYAAKYICDADGNIAKKVVIKKLSGLNDIAQNNSINIYPNPASNNITIEGKGEVTITNSLGQVVKHIKDNNDVRTLNIKDFESGVYYIKVGESTQKLLVE